MIFMCFVCMGVVVAGKNKGCTREGTPLENILNLGILYITS